jgi:drug/metabolite transporter (DMT)-like permease
VNHEAKGMLLGLVGVSVFGLTLPVTRFVVATLDPLFIGLGRAVIAGLCAALLLFLMKEALPNRKQIKQLMLVALGVVIAFPLLSSWAMQSVPAAHGGVVIGVLPLVTVVLSTLLSSERPSLGFWLSAVVGSMLVVIYAGLQGMSGFYWGDLALLAAVVSAAIGYVVGGKLSQQLGGWRVICWALVLSLPFTLIPASLLLPHEPLRISLTVWAGFLYLALFSQLFGFFFWYKGLVIGGIARVSQVQLLQPFITLLASVVLLGEVVDQLTILFAALVVGMVAISKKTAIRINQ